MPNATPQTRGTEADAPFFQAMQRDLNEFFDRFRSRAGMPPDGVFDAFAGPGFPAIDVVETGDAIEVTAEIPGVAEGDLDITIAQNTLVLKGEKSSERKDESGDVHVVERRYGSFRRQIPLGFMPAEGAVRASFANGVLTLTVPKPAEARAAVQKISLSKA